MKAKALNKKNKMKIVIFGFSIKPKINLKNFDNFKKIRINSWSTFLEPIKD